MAQCCVQWEDAVDEGKSLGLRIAKFRTGVVLDKGGALAKMATPVKWYVGSPLGSGKQWIPWIHIQDLIDMYLFAVENERLEGVFNMAAPNPVTNKQLTKAIAKQLRKPLWLPNVPAFLLKLLLGEMSVIVLGSTKVSAQKIEDTGFKFAYTDVADALKAIYEEKHTSVVFWFRRDLRLDDNAGLYYALKGEHPVLPVFIFDRDILDKLEDKDDARVTFIYQTIITLKTKAKLGSTLITLHDKSGKGLRRLLKDRKVATVYANHDYEPGAKVRDESVANLLAQHDIPFKTFKDQVIFEKDEVIKENGSPYLVYTPYNRKWYEKLTPFYLAAYPNNKYFKNFIRAEPGSIPSLKDIGFEKE